MECYEDQVISVVSSALRGIGVPVLAEGGNQMRAFRFTLPTGRRKSPDLVFVLSNYLFVLEAKIRASDLFRLSRDGFSDYDSMRFIGFNEEAQERLIAEGHRRLDACGHGDQTVSAVVTGLIAAESILTRAQPLEGMQAIRVDLAASAWFLEGTAPNGALAAAQLTSQVKLGS